MIGQSQDTAQVSGSGFWVGRGVTDREEEPRGGGGLKGWQRVRIRDGNGAEGPGQTLPDAWEFCSQVNLALNLAHVTRPQRSLETGRGSQGCTRGHRPSSLSRVRRGCFPLVFLLPPEQVQQ